MSPNRVFEYVGIVLVISLLSLIVINTASSSFETVTIGYFIGSFYAHASLAGAWSVLGPGNSKLRFTFSLVWVIALPVTIAINIELHGRPQGAALPFGICLFGQWLVIQMTLVALVWWTGMHIRHSSEPTVEEQEDQSRYQFRILDLLLLITVSAIAMGVGRAVMPLLNFGGETPIFIFLAAAAVILTLPLLLSALMKRNMVVGVVLSLMLIVFGAYIELPLLRSMSVSRPNTFDLIAINVASAMLVLIVAAIVRAQGYSLYLQHRAPETR